MLQGKTVETKWQVSQKGHDVELLPPHVEGEVQGSIGTDLDEETGNAGDHIGGLSRSLSEIQLANEPVCIIFISHKVCLSLTYSQPRPHVASKSKRTKRQREDTEVCHSGSGYI